MDATVGMAVPACIGAPVSVTAMFGIVAPISVGAAGQQQGRRDGNGAAGAEAEPQSTVSPGRRRSPVGVPAGSGAGPLSASAPRSSERHRHRRHGRRRRRGRHRRAVGSRAPSPTEPRSASEAASASGPRRHRPASSIGIAPHLTAAGNGAAIGIGCLGLRSAVGIAAGADSKTPLCAVNSSGAEPPSTRRRVGIGARSASARCRYSGRSAPEPRPAEPPLRRRGSVGIPAAADFRRGSAFRARVSGAAPPVSIGAASAMAPGRRRGYGQVRRRAGVGAAIGVDAGADSSPGRHRGRDRQRRRSPHRPASASSQQGQEGQEGDDERSGAELAGAHPEERAGHRGRVSRCAPLPVTARSPPGHRGTISVPG